MPTLENMAARRLSGLTAAAGNALAVVLPGGQRIGPADANVVLRLNTLAPLAHVVAGQVGRLAEDYVEGRQEIDGAMRPVIDVASSLVRDWIIKTYGPYMLPVEIPKSPAGSLSAISRRMASMPKPNSRDRRMKRRRWACSGS